MSLLVDERANVRQFYPPDCILYSAGRAPSITYAACGSRVPAPVAFYPAFLMSGGYEVDSAGMRRVDTVRVVDGRAVASIMRVPIGEIRRVAESRPPLFPAWQWIASGDEIMAEEVVTEEPVDVTARNQSGNTALMEAVINQQRDVVDALIQQGADVNSVGGGKFTPLLMAIDFDADTLLIQRLLDAGANLDAIGGPTDVTPLIEAATINDVSIVRMLLARRANPCIRDFYGKTVVDYTDGPYPEIRALAVEAYARCKE